MVLGGPGVGKTWSLNTFRDLLRDFDMEDILGAAYMGTAASNIPGAGTIHRVFGIPIPKRSKSRVNIDLAQPNAGVRARLTQRLRNKRYLVIDEISMADATLAGKIDQRCRQIMQNNLPFGGLNVIFMGDFFQLPPTTGDPLYTSILKYNGVYEWAKLELNTPLAVGATLLAKFQYISLEHQVRSLGDIEQTKFIAKSRQFDEPVVTDALLDSLLKNNMLTSADFESQDNNYADSHIAVTTHFERFALTPHVAVNFGIRRGKPVIVWRESALEKLELVRGDMFSFQKRVESMQCGRR